MAIAERQHLHWHSICRDEDLPHYLGTRALIDDEQIAVFKIASQFYAISAVDPFTKTAVLSRGIVGDIKGRTVVASPLYKQHFDLSSGQCLEDDSVCLKTYPIRCVDGWIEIANP